MTNLSGKQGWTLVGATRTPHPDLVKAAQRFNDDRQSGTAKTIVYNDVRVDDEFQPKKGSNLIGGVITSLTGNVATYDYHYMGKWNSDSRLFKTTHLKGGYIRRGAEFMLIKD